MNKRTTTAFAALGLLVGSFGLSANATAASAATAEPTPAAPVAVVGTPVLTITPNDCPPNNIPEKTVTWDIPAGLAIGEVTGSGSAIDESATILSAATGGTQRPRSWILPVTVLDGYTYAGPTTVTLTQTTDAPGGDITKCVDPAAAQPNEPAQTAAPAAAAPAATQAPVPAVAVPVGEQAAAAPQAAAPALTGTDGELAYTGADTATVIGGSTAAAVLIAAGALLLVTRRRARLHAGE